ncbi:MAG: hypothetical protein Q7R33_09625 [Nitrosarchaeum sp.]|nr:hypothetical protein [Nitrosarchaeum sp.]
MNCAICEREIPDKRYIEKHHLTPDCEGGKDKILVCIDCGDQIHNLFSVHELRDQYDTLTALKANLRVQAWVKWIRKKASFGVCMKAKKRR